MNIHEYQAKEIFKQYGLPVLRGGIAFSSEEAQKIAEQLNSQIWVIKSQIHAGGRGKGGGVKIAKSLEEVATITKSMLGMQLVTHQTGPSGKQVQKVYVEEGAIISDEFYLGIVLDRAKEALVIMASTEGGVEIEDVASNSPEKIIKVVIDPSIGFQNYHGRELAFGLNLKKEQINQFISFAKLLYEIYIKHDAEMIEINPLISTNDGKFIALDAKIGFDNNALYRQPDIIAMRDLNEEEQTEIKASEYGLSYVKLDGNIGCMVNGAGLAMGTMDTIYYAGGKPANFLDIGGGASAQTVAKGFEIILQDKNVESIFVNIFGGIVRCDRVAYGILEAMKLVEVTIPIIVRLDGTNSAEALTILENAQITNILVAKDIEEGAKKAVVAAEQRRS